MIVFPYFILFLIHSCGASILFSLLPAINTGFQIVGTIWAVVEKSDGPKPFFLEHDQMIGNSLKEIDEQVRNLDVKMSEISDSLQKSLKALPRQLLSQLKYEDIESHIWQIEHEYIRMKPYMKNMSEFEPSTLVNFAQKTIEHGSSSLYNKVHMLHELMYGEKGTSSNKGFMNTIAKKVIFKKVWAMADTSEGPKPFFLENDQITANRMRGINKEILNLDGKLSEIGETLQKSLHDVPEKLLLELKYKDIQKHIREINLEYNRMQPYMRNVSEYEASTVVNFAHKMVEHGSSSLFNKVAMLQKLMYGGSGRLASRGYINSITNTLETSCTTNVTNWQILETMYESLGLALFRSYTMIQFSYVILKLHNQGNYTKEISEMNEIFNNLYKETAKHLKNNAHHFPRVHKHCGPTSFVKGKNYEEITRFLQGYIENEVDMSKSSGCFQNCAAYSEAKSLTCYQNQFCSKQRKCTGKIYDCKFIESWSDVCLEKKTSDRRYKYITYNSGKRYGKYSYYCPGGFQEANSWWRYLFWHCSYCMCICDEQGGNSHRHFSLRPMQSNIAENYVVTGIRFQKVANIIHLQIQEGKLLSDFSINGSTVHWVPVNSFKVTDRGVYDGKDFFTLSRNQRSINLNDIEGNENEFVTGVAQMVYNGMLTLKVRFHRVSKSNDFHASGGGLWKEMPLNSKELDISNKDVPTNCKSGTIKYSPDDSYLKFTHTSFGLDAAQTAVPFIDLEPVMATEAVPLSGLGLYYKFLGNCGGFLAPKVITYNPSFIIDMFT